MPVVTVSRGTMSGGTALAEQVARELGAPCIGREIVVAAAAQLGVGERVLADAMEKGPRLWERFRTERRTYVAAVQAALAEYVASGSVVYHGLAGHMLLRGVPAVLRVRLVAPLEMRVRMLMEKGAAASVAEAEAYIRDVDAARARWTKYLYGVDLLDPALYDLVINLESLSVAGAAALVAEAAKKRRFLVTPEVRAELADFAVACRVRVALATAAATRGLELDATASGGVVTVRGEVPLPATLREDTALAKTEIRDVVLAVRDVNRVELDLTFTHEDVW